MNRETGNTLLCLSVLSRVLECYAFRGSAGPTGQSVFLSTSPSLPSSWLGQCTAGCFYSKCLLIGRIHIPWPAGTQSRRSLSGLSVTRISFWAFPPLSDHTQRGNHMLPAAYHAKSHSWGEASFMQWVELVSSLEQIPAYDLHGRKGFHPPSPQKRDF